MELLSSLIEFTLHLDVHLAEIIRTYGTWTYAVLFFIVFMETGFVVTPFLPGDSLLFATGTFAALGALDVKLTFVLLVTAAILGDAVNYWIGHSIGPRAFSGQIRFLKKEYLDRTHEFYEKHGGKTIVLARFIPIIRTFAPFVAGVAIMSYPRFATYNVLGAFLWVTIFLFGGYFFGNIPIVKQNFELVIVVIIFLSVLPPVFEFLKMRLRPAAELEV